MSEPLTNDGAVALLEETRDRLLKAVQGIELGIDPRLAFTLGGAMGVIIEGLNAFREDRPLSLTETAMLRRMREEGSR